MAKIDFDFTSPLTTMRKEPGTGRIRPSYVGELHAVGVGNYDPGNANQDYRISYTLTEYTFKTDVKREDLHVTSWAGGSLITLELAHDLIILHIEKLLGLDTETESSYKVHDYKRDDRGGIFTLYYTDGKGAECVHPVSEVEFGQWLSYTSRTNSVITYWSQASIQKKKRDFSKYLSDLMTFMTVPSAHRAELEYRDAPMGTL